MEFFNDVCSYTHRVQNTHHVKQTRVAHAVLILIAAFMFMFLAGFGSAFENKIPISREVINVSTRKSATKYTVSSHVKMDKKSQPALGIFAK